MESCHFWGLTPSAWARETLHSRAKMVAHFLEKRTREGYEVEKMESKTRGPKGKGKQKQSRGMSLDEAMKALGHSGLATQTGH